MGRLWHGSAPSFAVAPRLCLSTSCTRSQEWSSNERSQVGHMDVGLVAGKMRGSRKASLCQIFKARLLATISCSVRTQGLPSRVLQSLNMEFAFKRHMRMCMRAAQHIVLPSLKLLQLNAPRFPRLFQAQIWPTRQVSSQCASAWIFKLPTQNARHIRV